MASFLNIISGMKKALVIVLVMIHLLGTTEVGQLLRVPALLSHYFQHHRQDNSISFFEFISMHYGGDDGTDADNDYDGKLPCHNLHHNTISLVFSPMLPAPVTGNLWMISSTQYSTSIQSRISSAHVMLPLQPPRA